jgi:hypothetical protein
MENGMKLFQIITQWFSNQKASSTEYNVNVLNEMFISIMREIEHSRTLGELLQSRQSIREYHETVVEFNSPVSSVNKGKLLDAKWNLKYRLWKLTKY